MRRRMDTTETNGRCQKYHDTNKMVNEMENICPKNQRKCPACKENIEKWKHIPKECLFIRYDTLEQRAEISQECEKQELK